MRWDVLFFGRKGTVVAHIFWWLYLLLLDTSSATISGTDCDWSGSGLLAEKGIRPVYLRCSAGKISWLYPNGGLRVVLKLPAEGREFRACLKWRTKEKPAVRIFLEGPRSLLPLYSHNDNFKATRCFQSRNGQAAIYVESLENNSVNKRTTEFEYDLQPLTKERGYDPAEECRPCTKEEMVHAFCSSDLVTRGTIHAIEHNEELEETQMMVQVTKYIRRTSLDIDQSLDHDEDEDVSSREGVKVEVRVPSHCDVSTGLGEFVFMARRRLGTFSLQCAPRLEHWTELALELRRSEKAHCMLNT